MEVGLTFGSLGDIIAVCQLAIQLGRAIASSQYGSAAEFQALKRELDVFLKVLMQVVAIYPQHELTPYLGELDTVTKQVVEECADLIQKALARWQRKYGQALSPDGSGNVLKDASRKVEWYLREKERVAELRAQLDRGVQRMTLLSALAVRKSARADNATMLVRVDEIKRLVSQNSDVQRAMLRLSEDQNTQLHALAERMKKQEEDMAESMRKQDENNWKILSQAKSSFCALLEVKDMLHHVCTAIVDIRGLLLSQATTRSLDPTKGLPLIVEDALGNIIEVPLDLVHSWEAFRFLLAHQFENKMGHHLVLGGRYSLEEACTTKDIDTSLPFTASVRRGMKINMSMIFEVLLEVLVEPRCPRCQATTSTAQEKALVQCANEQCRVWFRIMRPRFVSSSSGTMHVVEELHRGLQNDKQPSTDDMLANASWPSLGTPSDFQRVRIIPSELVSTVRRLVGVRGGSWQYTVLQQDTLASVLMEGFLYIAPVHDALPVPRRKRTASPSPRTWP